ncbi:MAG: YggS family pyridoxal phosphate-dependent enzyme [Treponema sp.]|nr:YggS family pyridoxal phosphate-dependent enzyme [Treponema sp.]
MTIKERIEKIRERIEGAAIRSGRKPGEIRLMGVSKFHGAGEITEAVQAGLFLFGESRVQEAEGKFPPLKETYPALELHLIGNLQQNKVKRAISVFDGIQSADRDELISALGTAVGKNRTALTVLLELHTGEDSKSGYPNEDSLSRAVELILSFPGLKLSGLMTMAPLTQDEAMIRRAFKKLYSAQGLLRRRFPEIDFSCLSMGMSGDFETAIEEGSTLVRVGTAIFGEEK